MRDLEMARTLRSLALDAGAAILAVRESGRLMERSKADDSPVTAADLAADQVICAGLAEAYPDLPVVSEERADSHGGPGAAAHFLVDPLDGTREFLRADGEFTVNIALIENGRPVAGVVYAPAIGRLFRTEVGGGAVEERGEAGSWTRRAVRVAVADNAALRAVASRSHRDPETDAFLARHAVTELRSAGSSLKFCLVAVGEADVYPRFGPTMEWDTAAGQAVLEAAGGLVLRAEDGAPLRYGAPERRNPSFVAVGEGVDVRL